MNDFTRRPATSPAPTLPTPAHYRILALGMLLFAVYGNLIPFQYQPRRFDDAVTAFRHIGWYDPASLGARGDWIVSVVLFLILSYLLMATVCVDRSRRLSYWLAPVVILFCAALSVAIEFTQIYFPPRTVSINDIVAETAGGIAGVVLWTLAGQRITRWMRRVAAPSDLAGLARRLLPGYIAFMLIVELMPFDFTISAAELAAKFHEHKLRLLPFAGYSIDARLASLVKIATNLACFFPLGLLDVLASNRRQHHHGWRRALLLGAVAATVIELLQFFVYSRVCDTTDIVTGTAGVWLGWLAGDAYLAAGRPTPGPSHRGLLTIDPAPRLSPALIAALALGWFAVVLYLNWSPFDFTTDPAKFEGDDLLRVWGIRRMSWLPFVDYYWGSKYQALDQFLKKSFSFLPLGVLCALASTQNRHPRSAPAVVVLALLTALLIEIGRYFLPSHAASVTDLLLQCAGAWLGFRLTQHIRLLLWAQHNGLINLIR